MIALIIGFLAVLFIVFIVTIIQDGIWERRFKKAMDKKFLDAFKDLEWRGNKLYVK